MSKPLQKAVKAVTDETKADVVRLINNGVSRGKIAADLKISHATISNIRKEVSNG